MSWAAEEWKDGLPQKALLKISQIESQLERFKKERDQKQFQLESLEQALEKRKGCNEKSELAALKRENQSLTESCQELEIKKEKLSSDLLLKENQVTCLEQKIAELSGQQTSGKDTDAVSSQADVRSNFQSQTISSLEQEIAELRKQLTEKNEAANHAAKPDSGDETNSTKPPRHLSESDELRKTQQELQALRSLVSELELKNKKLIQDGECTRHNTEAARQHLELKMKESEKELKHEVAQALEVARNAERTLQESKSKWQQEMNAAQAEQNRVKALIEKLEVEKTCLMKEQEDYVKKVAAADAVMKSSAAEVMEVEKKRTAWEIEKQKLASELDHKDREFQLQSAEVMKLKNDIGLKDQANEVLKVQVMDRTLEQERIKAEAEKMSQKVLQAENQLMEIQKQKQKADECMKEMTASLTQLQNDKEKVEKSNIELTKQLEKAQTEMAGLSASLKDTQMQLSQVECNFKESQHKWQDLENSLKSELAQNISTLTDLRELKTKLENQISFKDTELLELTDQCRSGEKNLSDKNSEIKQKVESIRDLEKQLQTLLEQNEALKKEQHQQQMFAKEKMTQVEATLIDKTEELEMLTITSATERTQFEAEIEKLLSQKQTLELDLNSCRTECRSGKDLIGSLNDEIKKLKAELDAKETASNEMNCTIQNQQRELQEKVEENASLMGEVNQKDQLIESVKANLAAAQKELENLQKELSITGENYEKLETENVSLISKIEECKRQNECGAQLKQLHETQITELQKQLEMSQNENSSLLSQANLERERNISLEKEVNNLHNNCHELENRISAYKTDLEEKTVAICKLEEQCVLLSQTLGEERAENNICINKLSILETQLTESDKRHQDVVGEMSEKLQEASLSSMELKGLLAHKEDKVTELEKEISKLKEDALNLEALYTSVKEELEKKESLILTLEERCASISDELEAVNLKVAEKELLLCSHIENLTQMESRVRQLDEEKASLEMSSRKEIDTLHEQLHQQEQDMELKGLKITDLEDHVNELSTKLSETLKEASESDERHTQEIGMLKSKLDMLQMDFDDTDSSIQDLSGKVSNLTMLLENMTRERDSLKTTSQSVSIEFEELKSLLEIEKEHLSQLNKEHADLKEKNNNLEITMDNVQTELDGKKAVLEEKEVICENAQKLITDYEQQLKQYEMEKDQFITKVNDLKQTVSLEKESVVCKTKEIETLAEKCALLSDNLEKVTEQFTEQSVEVKLKTENLYAVELKLKELEENNLRAEETASRELAVLQKLLLQKEETLTQIATTKDELEKCTEDLKSKLDEITRMKSDEDDQHDQEIAAHKSQLEMLQMDVEDKDDIIQELKTKICNLESQIEVMSQEKVKLVEAESSLESDMLELKTALGLERQTVAHAKMNEDSLNERVRCLESVLSETRHELEEKETCLQNLHLKFENVGEINVEHEKQVKQFQDEKEELTARIEDLQTCLTLEKQALLIKSTDFDTVSQQCMDLSDIVKNMKVELSQQTEKLTSQLEILHQMENRLKEQEAELTELREASSKEVEQIQQKLHETECDLRQRVFKIECLENHILDIESKLSDAQRVKSEEGDQHGQEIAAHKSQLEMLQMDVESKDDIIQELKTKICNLESQIEVMSQEKVKLVEAESSLESEVLELKTALDVERQTVAHVRMNEDSLNERVRCLESVLSETRHELEEKETCLKNLHLKFENVGEINVEHEKQVKQFQDEKEELTGRIEDLQTCLTLEKQALLIKSTDFDTVSQQCMDLSDIVKNMSSLESDMLELKTALDMERQTVAHIRMNEDSLNERVRSLDSALTETRRELEEKETYLQNLHSELEIARNTVIQYEKDNKEIQGEKDNLSTIIENLQCTSSSDKLMIESKTSELNTVNEYCASLLGELETLKSDLVQKQKEISTRRQNIVRMESKIDQLEKEKMIVEERLYGDVEKLQAVLVQNDAALSEKSSRIVDLENCTEGLQIKLSGITEERILQDVEKSVLDSLQLGLKGKEDIIYDLNTKLSQLNDTLESLSKEQATLEVTCQVTKADLETERESHTDTKKYCKRQQDVIEHLETSLGKIRALVLENENHFADMKCKIAQECHQEQKDCTAREHDTGELSLHIFDLEHKFSSLQEIASYLVSEIGTHFSHCSGLQEKLGASNNEVFRRNEELHELSQRFQHMKVKLQQLEMDKKTFVESVKLDAVLQIQPQDRSEKVMQNTAELEESHLQLSSLHSKYFEGLTDKTNDDTYHMKESAVLILELNKSQGGVEQTTEMTEQFIDEVTNLKAANEEHDTIKTTEAVLESENSLLRESYELLTVEHNKQMSEMQRLQMAVADLENRLKELTLLLESKEHHIVKTECQLKEALDGYEDFKFSMNQKLDQINSLEKTVTELQYQLESMNSEKSDCDKYTSQKMETMKLQLSTMKENLDSKSQELENLKTQHDDLGKSMLQSSSSLAELQAEKTAICEQLDEVKRLLKEAESDLHERNDMISILREEFDSVTQENDVLKTDKGEWQTKEDKYKQDIHELDVKLTDLNMEIESTRESFELVSNLRFDAQSKLQEVLLEKKDLENKFRDVEIELGEVKRFNENFQNLELQFESLKEKVLTKDEEISSLKALLDKTSRDDESEVVERDLVRKQKEELESELNEVKDKNKGLEEQLLEFTSVITDMKDQLAQLQDLIQSLNNNVDLKKKEIVQRVNEISDKNDEISRLKTVIEEKDKINSETSRQITNIKKESDSTIGTLQDAIESLNFELLAAEEEKTSLISDNDILKKESLEHHEKIKSMVAEIESLQNDHTGELQTQVSDLETAVAELKKLVTSLQKDNEELKIQVSALSMQETALSEQLKEKTAHCEDLSLQIETLSADANSSQKQFMEREMQLCQTEKSLIKTMSERDNVITSLQLDLDCSKEEIIKLKEKIDMSIHRCEQLKNENFKLMEEIKIESDLSYTLKGNLLQTAEELGKVLADKGHIEEKTADYESVLSERDQLKEQVQMLKSVEIEKQKIVEKLEQVSNEKELVKEKVLELEEVLVTKEKLEKMFEDVTFEKSLLQEKFVKLESDYCQLKTVIELREVSVKEMDQKIKDLTQEKVSFQEKLKKLESDNCQLEEVIIKLKEISVKEMDQKIKDLTHEKAAVQETLVKLESDNCQLEISMKEMDEKIKDLTQEKASLQDTLVKLESDNHQLEISMKEMDEKIKDLTQEKASLQDTLVKVESDNHQLEISMKEMDEKIKDLTHEKAALQDTLVKVESDNHQLEISMKEMDEKIKDLTQEKASLQDTLVKLESDNHQLEISMKEMDEKIKDLTQEKASLQETLVKLEPDNHQLEIIGKEMDQKIKDLTQENDSHQAKLVNLESDNCRLEAMIIELREISVKELDQKIKDMTQEKASLEEKLKKQQFDNCRLEDQMKEKQAAINEYDILKEKIEVQERTLVEKTEELNQVMSEKKQLEDTLKELQNLHSMVPNSQHSDKSDLNDEKQKELLRKWEQRCSELNAQLAMDRKKVQRLTEQVEKLKSSKNVESIEDIKTLKEELEEVKQERESYKEKYMQMSKAGERHFTRANELQRLNEKLNSRNKLLNALIKGEKPVKVLPNLPTCGILRDGAKKLFDKQKEEIKEVAKTVEENCAELSPSKIPRQDVQFKEEEQTMPHVRFDQKSLKSDLTLENDMVSTSSMLQKKSVCSALQEHVTSICDDQKVADMTAQTDSTATIESNLNRSSSRLRLRTPNVQSAQKSKISTPKSYISSHLGHSNQKQKQEISSKLSTPVSKPRTCTTQDLVLKTTASPAKLMTSSNPSQTSLSSNEPKRIRPAFQDVKMSEESSSIPSPRATRRMSLQKRRSTDQSVDAAGGKKSKLSVKETITEASDVSDNKSKLPQAVHSKLIPISALPRPMRTRAKKETLQTGNALTTITNSPKKIASLEANGSRRTRTSVKKLKSPIKQSTDEGPSDCKIN